MTHDSQPGYTISKPRDVPEEIDDGDRLRQQNLIEYRPVRAVKHIVVP